MMTRHDPKRLPANRPKGQVQGRIQQWFVKNVYADHNNSAAVQAALDSLIASSSITGSMVNIGAGSTQLSPLMFNVDIVPCAETHLVADGLRLPLKTASCRLIISQEAIEHMANPGKALTEIVRVLRPGGQLYLQLPFIIGYHSGPHDYWRFTHEGISSLVGQSGLVINQMDISVGGASGTYRILVEFMACLASAISDSLYKPVKALAAILCFPIKWFDKIINSTKQKYRLAGGYFIIATKP
jgi:SAM-dependent methyltransferase